MSDLNLTSSEEWRRFGMLPVAAAGVASLIGISSVVGRLGTGYLLDHFRASRVGAIIFLLPVVACTLLLTAGADPLAQSVAAVVIGLTLGSEIDVIVFLTSKHFGLKNFGAIYGGLLTALSIGMAPWLPPRFTTSGPPARRSWY